MLDRRPARWIGAVLQGKWRIESKIASGGIATVFRARHRRGQVAAIKILHPEYAGDADVRSRFLREGYAANKVGHPGVVRVLDEDVTEDGSAYLVMELLEDGELLEDRRKRAGGKLPAAEVVDVCDQLLDVLAAAHEQGIVHRDIKPENVFILADGAVKVLDFGIAHMKRLAEGFEATATGLLLGTPEFMSPEQALGQRGAIDAQTDVYAVGATMFTLLSGEPVHAEEGLTAMLLAVSSRPPRSLASTAAGEELPPELVAVVDRAVSLEKSGRWPSARAMQEALRSAVPSVSFRAPRRSLPGVPPPSVAPPGSRPDRSAIQALEEAPTEHAFRPPEGWAAGLDATVEAPTIARPRRPSLPELEPEPPWRPPLPRPPADPPPPPLAPDPPSTSAPPAWIPAGPPSAPGEPPRRGRAAVLVTIVIAVLLAIGLSVGGWLALRRR